MLVLREAQLPGTRPVVHVASSDSTETRSTNDGDDDGEGVQYY